MPMPMRRARLGRRLKEASWLQCGCLAGSGSWELGVVWKVVGFGLMADGGRLAEIIFFMMTTTMNDAPPYLPSLSVITSIAFENESRSVNQP